MMSKQLTGSQPEQFANRASVPSNMRPQQAALYTGISESTLAKLRMRSNRCNGPKFVRLSGCIIYRKCDLDHWIEQNLVETFGS